jgi:Flp pilus assembly protein TadD
LATYREATEPPRSARLDIAVESPPALAAQAQQLRRETVREIGRLRSTAQLAFSVQSSQPTHRLSSSLATASGKITLHALLRDVRSSAPVSEWSADFAPGQLRYAPVALAGVVSSALHLPPLTTGATVNAKAAASYQQGLALFQDDRRLDQAIAAFQSAATFDPDSALPYAGLAEAQRRRFFLTKLKSWDDQAAASLMQAEIRNPDCAEVHRIAGLLEFDANRPEQAIARMRRAAEFQPPHPDTFRRLGQLYQQTGQFAEALQALSEARRLAQRDVRIYQDLAHLYDAQSDFAQASEVLREAVALEPDRPLLCTQLAAALQDQGRFSDAETELRIALKQENSPATLVQLAHVLMYQAKDKDALPLLSHAASLDNRNSFAWLYLGLASGRQRRASDARNAFRQGLAVAEADLVQIPRSGYYHSLVGYFCAQTGQASRARVEAAQALQLAPQHSDTLWMTALTYERIGDRAAALQTLQAAPRSLLEDLKRWPEASALTADEHFSRLAPAR